MLGLAFYLLGPFAIHRAGQPFPLPQTRKAQSLLAYLLMHRSQTQPRERLTGMFWGDQSEVRARRSLSTALWRVRQSLPGENVLLADLLTIQFDPNTSPWVDVEAFEAHIKQGDRESLAQAAALYRGDFLDGLSDEWVEVMRRRLGALHLDALAQLAASYEQANEYQAALDVARRLLQYDPLREDAHRAAMQAYCRLGQRNAALDQYRRCQETVQTELAVEPMPETTALYKAILAGEIGPAASVFDAPVFQRPRHNLPASVTAFVGRSEELDEIAALLADPTCRLLTLVGPGGVGKTRLALEAAARQIDHFARGVFFVALQGLSDPAQLLPAIAEAVRFQFYEGGDPKTQLLNFLREKQMLLVMDNFEHLLDGAALVTEILQAAPRVKVLATSREVLDLEGEWVRRVEGLHFPENGETEMLEAYDAVQLFVERARRVRGDFVLADVCVSAARVCQLVEGLPLAIELAAAWLKSLPCTAIADEIERGMSFLTSKRRDLPTRHRSIHAVFERSWRLLSEKERAVFTWLSVFRGGFEREAAEHVTGADLETLASLVDKSFLRRGPRGRYEVHELLRQYGAAQLEAVGEVEAARDAHSAYYAGFMAEREIYGPRLLETLNAIEADFENVRLAWEWAVKKQNEDAIGQMLKPLRRFCNVRNRFIEGEALFREALDRLSKTNLALRLALLVAFATMPQSHLEEKRRAVEEALVLAHELGDPADMAEEIAWLGDFYTGKDEPEKAKRQIMKGLALARADGNKATLAQVFCYAGEFAWLHGPHEEAEAHFAEGLRLAREIDDLDLLLRHLFGLGLLNG